MLQMKTIKVGMADLDILIGLGSIKTIGLGSCVGVILYDPYAMVSGMAHVMLPNSDIAKDKTFNVAKYADTAIPVLLQRVVEAGAKERQIKAKLAGGAQMFTFSKGMNDTIRIGPRNGEAIKQILGDIGIPIIAEDMGGNYGRTIEFFNESSKLLIRSAHHGSKEI